jgi:hypothetical protein
MQSEKVKILRLAKLIVWDEITMAFKSSLEILDVLLRDAMVCVDPKFANVPFGGKTIVLAGDWRQMLPVVPRGSRGAIVGSTVKRSKLWHLFRTLEMTTNMRVVLQRAKGQNADELDAYAKWLLEVGDGRAGEHVAIPHAMQAPMDDLDYAINWLFGNTNAQQNCILSSLNCDVDRINDGILDKMNGESMDYYSADYFPECESSDAGKYPVEFLNSITPSGLPLSATFPPNSRFKRWVLLCDRFII